MPVAHWFRAQLGCGVLGQPRHVKVWDEHFCLLFCVVFAVLCNAHLSISLPENGHMAVAQKKRYQHGTLVSENMDQNLRNPPCLMLSHSHIDDCQTKSFSNCGRHRPL